MFKSNMLALAVSAATLSFATPVLADNYPSKEIYFPIGYTPGTISDQMARVFAEGLEKELGQPITLENIPSMDGNYINDEIVKAPSDGYTLTIINIATLASNLKGNENNLEPLKQFTLIGNIAASPNILVVSEKSPHKTYKEVEAQLKKNKGKYSYGTSPKGAMSYLIMETIKKDTGISMLPVTYRVNQQASSDVASQKIDLALIERASAMKQLKEKSIRVLAVSGNSRIEEAPDAPTFKELGIDNINREAFFTVVGPKGMPKDVVIKLQNSMEKILKSPETINKIQETGSYVKFMKDEQLENYISSEFKFYLDATKKIN